MADNITKTAEEIVYPLTIIPCRYGGCYSGAKFHAFNMEHKSIPEAATGDDVSCSEFWGGLEPSGRHKDYRVNDWGENLFIGSGETPQAAYDNLREKMGLMMEEYRSQSDKGMEQEKDTIIQQLREEVERLREEKTEWNEKQRLNYEQKIIEQEETISALRSQLSQQPTNEAGQVRKERLNYVIEGGKYCGHLVNLPVVVQAESLEEMVEDAKILSKAWVEHLNNTLSQDEPFDIVEHDFESYMKRYTQGASKKPSPEQYLIDILNKLTGRVYEGKQVWYLGDQWVFEVNYKNKILWCHYWTVWEKFYHYNDMKDEEIKQLMQDVVCKALNLEGFTPTKCKSFPLLECVKP